MVLETEQSAKAKEEQLGRANWIGIIGILLSVTQVVYVAGVVVQRINEQDRRLSALESASGVSAGKIETLLVTTTRIDANVAAIVDRENRREVGKP